MRRDFELRQISANSGKIPAKFGQNLVKFEKNREWVASQMSFLAKPMRITGIRMQLEVHCYVVNMFHETSIIGDIVNTLIEEATHSFTRLLL